jgi:hypothetical protein
MEIFVEVEGINMNNFPFWSNFKIGIDFELKTLEYTHFGNRFEFLRALMDLVEYPEIHQKCFLL